MKLLLMFILFFSNNIFADDVSKRIICGFSECRPDFNASIYLEKATMTFIDVGDFNTDTLEVLLPVNQEPRALFLNINNNDVAGKDLFVDMQSKREGYNSDDFILIGDVFDNVNINMDGYQGISGKDASQICGDRIKNDNYGTFFKTQFNERREADPKLPKDRCVDEDIEEIQRNSFECINETSDAEYSEEEFSLVNIERVKYKQRCTGNSVKYKCVKRKVRIECQWEALPYGFSASGFPCTNRWGGNNCVYNVADSCWRSRDLNAIYGGGSSYPPGGGNPWELVFDTNRCSYPGNDSPKEFDSDFGMSGGAVAYNLSTQMYENEYKNSERNGNLESLCQQKSAGPTGPGWRFAGVSEVTYEQPGLDLDTLEPLPGSTWEVAETGFFEDCKSTHGDSYEVLSPILEFWSTFGEIGNDCRDVSIAEDPEEKIPWTLAGSYQDRTFGTELLLCSPDNCSVETITKRFESNFDIIEPTPGTSGTMQGDAILFVYDIDNLSATANSGLAGQGGDNDLPSFTDTKYCVKIKDSDTQGINSEFALKPVVYFNEYEWRAISVGPGQPGGEDAPYSTKGIKLYKKIDSSVRYLLKNDNF